MGTQITKRKNIFMKEKKSFVFMRLFNLQRIEAIITDALWTRTARVFAKCQRGMTVTLLLAQAQDVAAEERGANTQCSV